MVIKCKFCGNLFEGEANLMDPDNKVCGSCKEKAKQNTLNQSKQKETKRFVESDGFFNKEEYLEENNSFHDYQDYIW